jgi:hypothetical protein
LRGSAVSAGLAIVGASYFVKGILVKAVGLSCE